MKLFAWVVRNTVGRLMAKLVDDYIESGKSE